MMRRAGLILTAALLLSPAPAFAQGGQIDWEATILANIVTSTTTSGLAVFAGTISLASPISSDTDYLFVDARLARDYLDANAAALSAEIAVGAGPHIDDLAAMCGMGKRSGELGRALRDHRTELIGILNRDGVALEDVATFAQVIRTTHTRRD